MNIGKSTRLSLAHVNKPDYWLADKIGVSSQYVGQVCNEKKEPSLKLVRRMAGVFNLKVSEFIARGEVDEITC